MSLGCGEDRIHRPEVEGTGESVDRQCLKGVEPGQRMRRKRLEVTVQVHHRPASGIDRPIGGELVGVEPGRPPRSTVECETIGARGDTSAGNRCRRGGLGHARYDRRHQDSTENALKNFRRDAHRRNGRRGCVDSEAVDDERLYRIRLRAGGHCRLLIDGIDKERTESPLQSEKPNSTAGSGAVCVL